MANRSGTSKKNKLTLGTDIVTRVRCIGNGTITDVSSALLSRQSTVSSPRLAELNVKLSNLTHTLNRAQTVSSTIHNYVQGVDFEHLDISKLSDTMDIYDAAEEKWDVKLVELELEIEALKEQIAEEEDTLRKENKRKNLARMEVTVNIITPSAQRLDLELEYCESSIMYRVSSLTEPQWSLRHHGHLRMTSALTFNPHLSQSSSCTGL